MREQAPENFKVVKVVLDNGEMRFTIQGPNQRNYPDNIKERDHIYYFDARAPTFDEALNNLLFLIRNKVDPDWKARYADIAIERIQREVVE